MRPNKVPANAASRGEPAATSSNTTSHWAGRNQAESFVNMNETAEDISAPSQKLDELGRQNSFRLQECGNARQRNFLLGALDNGQWPPFRHETNEPTELAAGFTG